MRTLLLSAILLAGLAFGARAQAPEITATCRDGSSWSGTTRRGACSGHQGVQAFGAVASTAAVPTTGPAAPPPAATPATPPARYAQPTPASPSTGGPGQVWVNTSSRVYHCAGDRYYGNTRRGSYMTEAAAKAEGDRPSRGKTCS